MGNHFVQSNTNEKTVDHPLNMNNFNFSGMFKDDRMGEINELEYIQTKEKVFLKELTLKNVQSLTEFHLNALYKRCKLRHPNLLLTIGFNYSINHSDGIKNMKMNLYFEPYKSDLADDIYKRKNLNLHYAEHELLTLMDRLVSVLAMLQKNDVAHGNICSQNILINDKDLIKIADHCMLTSEYSQYYQALNGIISNYIAPELMQLLAKSHKNMEIFNDYRHKSDVFALGMLFLELALLDSNDKCYNWKIFALLDKNLIARLDRVYVKYSRILVNLIGLMLNLNPEKRTDFIELKREIENSKKIIDMGGSGIRFTLDQGSSFSFSNTSFEKVRSPVLKINQSKVKDQNSQYWSEISQKPKKNSSNLNQNDSLLNWMFKSCITPVNTDIVKTLILSNLTSNDGLQNEEILFHSDGVDINLTGDSFRKQPENITLASLDEKILKPKTFKQSENVTMTNLNEKTLNPKAFNVLLEKNNSFSKNRNNKGSFFNATNSNNKEKNYEDYLVLGLNHKIENHLIFDYNNQNQIDIEKDMDLLDKVSPLIENRFSKKIKDDQSYEIQAPFETDFESFNQKQINPLGYEETLIPMNGSIQPIINQMNQFEISDHYILSSPHFGNQYFQFPHLKTETMDNSPPHKELYNFTPQSIPPNHHVNNKSNGHAAFTFGDGSGSLASNRNLETNYAPMQTASHESRANTPKHNDAPHLNIDLFRKSQNDYQIDSNNDPNFIKVPNADQSYNKAYSSGQYPIINLNNVDLFRSTQNDYQIDSSSDPNFIKVPNGDQSYNKAYSSGQYLVTNSNNVKIIDSQFYSQGHHQQYSGNNFLSSNDFESLAAPINSEYFLKKQSDMSNQISSDHNFHRLQIEQGQIANSQNQYITTNVSFNKDSMQIIQSQNLIYPIRGQSSQLDINTNDNINYSKKNSEIMKNFPDNRQGREELNETKAIISPLKLETSKYKLKAPLITVLSSVSSDKATNNIIQHSHQNYVSTSLDKFVVDEENKISNRSVSKDNKVIDAFYNPNLNLKNVPILNISNFSFVSYNNIEYDDVSDSSSSMVSSSLSY